MLYFLLLFASFYEKYRVFVCVLGRGFGLHVVVTRGPMLRVSCKSEFVSEPLRGRREGRGGLLSLSTRHCKIRPSSPLWFQLSPLEI